MSALTKLFVVLLVICSLLVSASVVVFVNRVEDFRAASATSDARLKAQEDANHTLVAELKAQAGALSNALALADQEQADYAKQEEANKTQLGTLNVQIADLNNKLAESAANENHLTSTVQAAQDESKAQAQLIADLRKASDDLNRKNFDLNNALTEATSTSLSLQKKLEYTLENLSDAQKQLAQDQKVMQANHLQSSSVVGMALPPLTPVKGTVKAVNRFDGNVYATLDVGSSASVGKGMQFYAYNHDTGDFLGSITINKVDSDESIGIVQGPRVNDVKQGTEVATQIQ